MQIKFNITSYGRPYVHVNHKCFFGELRHPNSRPYLPYKDMVVIEQEEI